MKASMKWMVKTRYYESISDEVMFMVSGSWLIKLKLPIVIDFRQYVTPGQGVQTGA